MNYISYKDYLKTRNYKSDSIFIGKTNKSYLIGPKTDSNFDEYSFYKRIISSSVYSKQIYKRVFKRTGMKLANQYFSKLDDNEVLEISKNKKTIIHKIISLPRGAYGEK